MTNISYLNNTALSADRTYRVIAITNQRLNKYFFDQQGFTLAETLFAGVIMMGAIITVISLLGSSVTTLAMTNTRQVATQIGNEQLEKGRNYDYEQLHSTGTWPTDDPDLTGTSYRDVDSAGNPTYRTIDYDASNGLPMWQYIQRKHGRFWVYTYVMWVTDQGDPQAYKRVLVKVKWKGPTPGEVILSSNFSKEDSQEPRPGLSLQGVVSSNLNYFSGVTQNMVLGAEDSIRGTVTLRAKAKNNSGKSTGISKVEANLYSPGGVLKATKTATSPDGAGLYNLVFDVGDPSAYPDSEGYVFVVDAYDTIGGTQRASMRVAIDNRAPLPVADTFKAKAVPGSAMQNEVTWDWAAAADDGIPKISRFILQRRRAGGSWAQIAALPGDERRFIDAALETGVTYNYRMYAVDAAGNWALSAERDREKNTELLDDVVAPSVPTSVTAEPAAWNRVSLTWDASADDVGGSGLSGYYFVASDGTASTIVGYSGPTGYVPEFYQDYGMKGSATYTYTVYAYDLEGNISAPSSGAVVTTPLR